MFNHKNKASVVQTYQIEKIVRFETLEIERERLVQNTYKWNKWSWHISKHMSGDKTLERVYPVPDSEGLTLIAVGEMTRGIRDLSRVVQVYRYLHKTWVFLGEMSSHSERADDNFPLVSQALDYGSKALESLGYKIF